MDFYFYFLTFYFLGLKRVLKARQEMIDQGVADWAIGEALAFATLLTENIHVRISGQDVERGTFRFLINFIIINIIQFF